MENPEIVTFNEKSIFIRESEVGISELENLVDVFENGNNVINLLSMESDCVDIGDFESECHNCEEEKDIHSMVFDEKPQMTLLCEDCFIEVKKYVISLSDDNLNEVLPHLI